MNKLIVGEEGCSVKEIMQTIENSPSARSLVQKCWKLAEGLSTPSAILEDIITAFMKSEKGVLDVVNIMLVYWTQRMGTNAKLCVLLEILADQCECKELSDNLREHFRLKIAKTFPWTNLDEASKQKILDRRVHIFGNKKLLREVVAVFGKKAQKGLLNIALSQSLINEMLDGESLVMLTHFECLKPPEYYISRKLTCESVIDPKIFHDEKCSDIFVFDAISYSQLTSFTGNHKIDRSSAQAVQLNVRFIILEFQQDFQKICQVSDKNAVHLLSYKNEKFHWNKTCGSLKMIQKYGANDEQQDVISEKEFWNEKIAESSTSTNSSILISGGSGSGKSTLLQKICVMRRELHPNRPSIFATFPKLTEYSLNDQLKEIASKDDSIRLISGCISANDLGKEIVAALLKHDTHPLDIFLDDFDHVHGNDYQHIATKLLKVLCRDFPNVSVFVNVGKQKRRELERNLNVITYNLAPFQQAQQVSIIEQYWLQKCRIEAPDQTTLSKLASSIVSTLVCSTGRNEIAGVPLQCTLLAEIFSEVALEHSLQPHQNFFMLPRVDDIFDKWLVKMYQMLITERFDQIWDDELREKLIAIHVIAAVELLFPNFPFDISEMMDMSCAAVDIEEIHSIGILQVGPEEDEEADNNQLKYRFGHHSHAEFILASFLVNALDEPTPAKWKSVLAELIFHNVLVCSDVSTDKENEDDSEDHLASCFSQIAFNHNSLCFFLNGCLDGEEDDEERWWERIKNITNLFLTASSPILQSKKMYEILDTCIAHGFRNLFELIAPLLFSLKRIANREFGKVSWQNFVFTATKYANVQFLGSVCGFVEALLQVKIDNFTVFNNKRFNGTLVFHPLDVAIRRGDVAVFNFILSKFQSRIKYQFGLFHPCVQFSADDSEDVINGKLAIMSTLLNVRREMLDEIDPISGTVPLLSPNIHWKLLERLILEGADVTVVTKEDEENVAHKAARVMTSEDFDKFCRLIVEKDLGEIFRKKNKTLQTALHIALERMQVNPNTVALLCSELKLTLDNPDGEQRTELFYAVAGHQSQAVLETILEFGGNLGYLGRYNQTVVHVAAIHGNVIALQYFFSLECQINAQDDNNCTPLHLALTEGGRNLNEIFTAALKQKADMFVVNSKGDTVIGSAMSEEHVWKLKPSTLALLKKSAAKKTRWGCFKM